MDATIATELPPVPPALDRLPKDPRGYPIFYTAFVAPDGTPDFRVLEMPRVEKCLKERRCGMCGEKLGQALCFITTALDLEIERYRATDPPMHEACARYALAVCPFLSRTTARRSGRDLPAGTPRDLFATFTRVPKPRERAPDGVLIWTRSYDRRWRADTGGYTFAKPYRVERLP